MIDRLLLLFRQEKVVLGLLVIFYLLTRLLFLTRLPLFTDESIYIYWAKYIAENHSHWFISLTDGKPPLLIWMMAILLKLFPSFWFLFAGRLASVIAGGGALIGIYQLAKILFTAPRTAYIAGLLYIFVPFILLYDRMALFDSLLSATLVWSVYFAVRFAKTRNWKDALWWGIWLGLAFLAKPTAIVFLGLTPVVVFLLGKKVFVKKQLKQNLIGCIIAVVIAEIINNLQRVSHVYNLSGVKDAEFQVPWSSLIHNPLQVFWGNLHGFFGWMIGYYTVPLFLVGVVGFILLFIKKPRMGITLCVLWIVPILALSMVGEIIFPRYMLFTTIYFLLPVAYFFQWSWQQNSMRYLGAVLGIVMLFTLLQVDVPLLIQPENANIPKTDYDQYVATQSSGYGLSPIMKYLDVASEGQHITVVTQGTFGLYPYAFTLQYWNNPKVTIVPRWPLRTVDTDILAAKKNGPVYIIFKEKNVQLAKYPVKLLVKAEKPGGADPIYLTELK